MTSDDTVAFVQWSQFTLGEPVTKPRTMVAGRPAGMHHSGPRLAASPPHGEGLG